MHVLRSVKGTMLTTASNANKHVAAVLKNVEGWLENEQSAQPNPEIEEKLYNMDPINR